MLYQLSHFRSGAAPPGRSKAETAGAESQIRTGDTAIFSRVLYQLSYLGPVGRRARRPDGEAEEVEYSLFVPGPNGYELVPQTGVPPQAGQTVELIFPDREEPAVFEVVRSGRPLPGGDVCVYLAQV